MRDKQTSEEGIEGIMSLPIKRVALGVRFQPHFQVADVFGELVDKILYSGGSPFGPSTFPLVRSNPMERTLVKEDTNNSLHLTIRDAILEMDVNTSSYADIEKLAKDYNVHVLDHLRSLAKPRGIERYGILLTLDECRNELSQMPVQHYLGAEFDEARSLQMRFTRRLPCLEARVKKNVDDFRNAIYIVEQDEDGEVNLRIDYQEYFNPALDQEDWQKKPYSKFVARGIDYFQSEFADWLKNLQGEPALVER